MLNCQIKRMANRWCYCLSVCYRSKWLLLVNRSTLEWLGAMGRLSSKLWPGKSNQNSYM